MREKREFVSTLCILTTLAHLQYSELSATIMSKTNIYLNVKSFYQTVLLQSPMKIGTTCTTFWSSADNHIDVDEFYWSRVWAPCASPYLFILVHPFNFFLLHKYSLVLFLPFWFMFAFAAYCLHALLCGRSSVALITSIQESYGMEGMVGSVVHGG